jgi:hypothetical protein
MSGTEVEVNGLFATPVAAVMLPGAEERNAELTEIILRRRAGQPSIGASSIGGWHSTRDIAEWGGKGIQEVLNAGQSVATQMTADRDGNPIKPDW